MNVPKSIDDLKALVANEVPEDLHLDYKRSAALEKNPDDVKTDLAKDVSAFANSDGGVIVFGIVEENKLPKSVDAGVDHSKWTRERIESVINANISPRIDGIEIHQIRISADRSAYVVAAPKSFRGPHQELVNHRYYKRFNFSSEPMEDYEIQDVRTVVMSSFLSSRSTSRSVTVCSCNWWSQTSAISRLRMFASSSSQSCLS